MGQDRDERVLAQIGRFARHVRAGDEIDTAVRGGGGRREVAVVGHERPAVAGEHLFHHRMPSALDDEIERGVDLRPHVVTLDRQLRQGRGHVDDRQRLGGVLDRGGGRGHRGGEPLERFELDAERAIRGAGDLGFERAQFGGGEAHLTGERLAMDEGRVERRRHQPLAVLRRHLDEIAEHVVVADFQALDAGLVGVARLHRRHHEARGVAQIAALVQRGFISLADETAVALH